MIFYCKECNFPKNFPDEKYRLDESAKKFAKTKNCDRIITIIDSLCANCKLSVRYCAKENAMRLIESN